MLNNSFVQSIPETTLPFFQEYDFDHLDPERDSDLFIERLLAYGNRDEVHWLLCNYRQARDQRGLSEASTR